MHCTKTTLKNGMRLLTVPMEDTNSLTLLVLFGTGSRYEEKRVSGISHFLEHMFFKGTKTRSRPGAVNRALDDMGADHNAFTSKEMTGYWVKAASKHFPRALDIVSDILLEPLLKEKEIQKERGAILQEMSMYLDAPQRRIHDVFETLLYGDQPVGWDIIGTKESLGALRRKDFLAYRARHYVAANAVAVVAGNVKNHHAIEALTQAFSALPRGRISSMERVREKQNAPVAKIEYKATDQTHLVVGARAYDMFSDKRYAATLLAVLLGGKTSSRLWHEIREQHGLAYAVSAHTEHFKDTGYFAVYAGVPHGKAKEVVRRVAAAFKKIRTDGVSVRELKRAKDYFRGQLAISLESSDEVASFYAVQELFRKTTLAPEEFMARIDRVSEADILSAAREIFVPKGLNAAIIGPHKGELEFAALLAV